MEFFRGLRNALGIIAALLLFLWILWELTHA